MQSNFEAACHALTVARTASEMQNALDALVAQTPLPRDVIPHALECIRIALARVEQTEGMLSQSESHVMLAKIQRLIPHDDDGSVSRILMFTVLLPRMARNLEKLNAEQIASSIDFMHELVQEGHARSVVESGCLDAAVSVAAKVPLVQVMCLHMCLELNELGFGSAVVNSPAFAALLAATANEFYITPGNVRTALFERNEAKIMVATAVVVFGEGLIEYEKSRMLWRASVGYPTDAALAGGGRGRGRPRGSSSRSRTRSRPKSTRTSKPRRKRSRRAKGKSRR